MFELNGKVALVTGAASGLGQAIAATFGKQGAAVVPTDRPGVSLDATVKMIEEAGAEAYPHDLDVTCEKSIAAAMSDTVAKYGHLDIVVSNAGLNRPMPLENVTEEVWDSVVDVNLKGGFFVAKAAAAVMKEQGTGGRILFTSSQAGLVARENQQPYCASKGGINSMTRGLAYDLAPYGINVNAVAPCFAMTELTRTRLEDPEYSKMVLGMIPLGRVVEPSEVGALFSYLASDEAAMITGQTVVIDGGWTMW